MTKRTFLCLWVLSCVFTTLVLSEVSRAADPVHLAWIQGRASFEKRSTVVPMIHCTSGVACPHPEPYWSLVVHSGEVHYEIAHPFAKGSSTAPDSIQVAGVTVRPGHWLLVEGTIYPLMNNYEMILDVKNVSLAPGPMLTENLRAAETLLARDGFAGAMNEGWICRAELGEATIGAQVWYGGRGSGAEGSETYHLQVVGRKAPGASLETLAKIDDVHVRLGSNQWLYAGENTAAAAQLMVRQQDSRLVAFPALLKLRRFFKNGGTVTYKDNEAALVCNPSRLVEP